MTASLDTDMYPLSSPIQLAFCLCLFGFFGTIISTSVFLKWQKREINQLNQLNHSNEANETNQVDEIDHHSNDSNSDSNKTQQQQQQQQQQPIPSQNKQQSQQHQQQQYEQYMIEYHHYQQQQQQQQRKQQDVDNMNNINNTSMHSNYYISNYLNNQHYRTLSGGLCSNTTQIILDWDDTIFPTSYTYMLLKNGKTCSEYIGENDWKLLEDLNNTVLYLILMYIQLFGAHNVCIVTNAQHSWFNQSCLMYKRLYSHLRNLIVDKYNIPVISAHDSYKRQKSSAFMNVLCNKNNIQKVICIGDSNEEYDAIHNVCCALRVAAKRPINYYRFKLLESPSLKAMNQQLLSIKKLDYHTISTQQFDQSYQFKGN